MTIWSDALDAIYDSDTAVNGTFSDGTAGNNVTLRMIDKTVGVAVGDPDNNEVQTILPAVVVRMSELNDSAIARSDIDNGTITIAGIDWRVKSHQLRSRPDGAQEVYIFLLGDPV